MTSRMLTWHASSSLLNFCNNNKINTIWKYADFSFNFWCFGKVGFKRWCYKEISYRSWPSLPIRTVCDISGKTFAFLFYLFEIFYLFPLSVVSVVLANLNYKYLHVDFSNILKICKRQDDPRNKLSEIFVL